jgi:hypothetical protein
MAWKEFEGNPFLGGKQLHLFDENIWVIRSRLAVEITYDGGKVKKPQFN